MSVGQVWIQFQGKTVVLFRPGQIVQGLKRDAQLQVQSGIVGSDPNRFAEVFCGLLRLALHLQCFGQQVVCGPVVGQNGHRPVQAICGLSDPILIQQRLSDANKQQGELFLLCHPFLVP